MTFSCKLCDKKVSIRQSDCNYTWQETVRSFFAVKGEVICDTCVDEIYNKCFSQIKKGRKYIRYDTVKRIPSWTVCSTFNKEKKC